MNRTMLLVFLFMLITGCATTATMTGRAYPAVNPLHVKVLFEEKPSCEYEELAFIGTPLLWNQNIAVQQAREKAAEIGADYVVIKRVHVNAFNDASVSAIAYKCGKVDREKVEINQ
ncbi:hypothetical protein LZ24_01309 [Desulfobotulus alkaliphilus]|uniref:Heavy-metal-binding protein n=1 Tax=Desulfobotulus alkaliphilus TaxID=622671 RepID=A0A562RVW1_9BACT|nr:hypothetical protein [Desulfobotulus alkaliphilus]TWI73221.1 hypothetical protein LZ24_01309 [Desulfobotulus alkaliphilus]